MNRRRILAGQNLFLSLKLIFSQFDVVFSRTPRFNASESVQTKFRIS